MNILKKGSRGSEVKVLQKSLNLKDDGIFGPLTEEAVRTFQRENGLASDGVVGPKTWAKLGTSGINSIHISKRRIDKIIIHCSDTRDGSDYTVDDIRRWHKQRGFNDVGYHYVIYRDGSIHNGRDVNIIGAHCTNYNAHSIGICYIGGRSADGSRYTDTRTEAQKKSMLSLLKKLKHMYPKATIHGHREFAAKACPCFDAKKEYQKI